MDERVKYAKAAPRGYRAMSARATRQMRSFAGTALFVLPYLNVTMVSSLEEFEREVLTHPIFLLI